MAKSTSIDVESDRPQVMPAVIAQAPPEAVASAGTALRRWRLCAPGLTWRRSSDGTGSAVLHVLAEA